MGEGVKAATLDAEDNNASMVVPLIFIIPNNIKVTLYSLKSNATKCLLFLQLESSRKGAPKVV